MFNITSVPFYVYKVTLQCTGQYYFGSRYAHVKSGRLPVKDLWYKYFSSSDVVGYLISSYGCDSFDAQIIYTSTDRDNIFWYEQEIIQQHIKDSLCLNNFYIQKNDNTKIFSVYGKTTWVKNGQLRFEAECPGEGWINSNKLKGLTTWVKEGNIVFNKTCPGSGWVKGSQASGTKFWVNSSGDIKRAKECPGPGWTCQGLNKGKRYWLNSQTGEALYSSQSPGKDWVNQGAHTGKRHWMNDKGDKVYSTLCPGEGFILKGHNTGRRHWINSQGDIKFQPSCPGDDWLPHNMNKGRKLWIKDGLRRKSVDCPGPGWVKYTKS